jgi:hypothetical protein
LRDGEEIRRPLKDEGEGREEHKQDGERERCVGGEEKYDGLQVMR